ncbi:MAG: hypothetical protein JXA94_05370 [Parachlamydiales bacterium]|nr:hypothetical protein [Parachlamydiales bacterium]
MQTLQTYRKKRDFLKTKEPKGKSFQKTKKVKKLIFVVQKHWAKNLHYDFRIQIGRSLRSWAVPKGMPKKNGDKRLAVLTENHPLEYAKFEGTIPEGQYGAGKVKIVDFGFFENIKKDKNKKEISLSKSFKSGQVEVFLKGSKIKGPYALIRYKDEKTWLLIKMKKIKS